MKDETLLTEKMTADYAWEISAFRRRIVQRGLTDGMRAPPSSPVIQRNL
jgi:hypothetical protein